MGCSPGKEAAQGGFFDDNQKPGDRKKKTGPIVETAIQSFDETQSNDVSKKKKKKKKVNTSLVSNLDDFQEEGLPKIKKKKPKGSNRFGAITKKDLAQRDFQKETQNAELFVQLAR